MLVWTSVIIVTEGIGGGNEIVGGIWVLLLNAIASKSSMFSKPIITWLYSRNSRCLDHLSI